MKRAGHCAIYIIGPKDDVVPVKIGIAIDTKNRLSGMQTNTWIPLEIKSEFWTVGEKVARLVEAKSHEILAGQ